jgi:cation transport protein ChaC
MAGPPAAPMPPLSAAARRRSLEETLAAAPDRDALRLFAYGSLMWNPCFEVADRAVADVDGYHRSFSIWSVHARGTPEKPGLGLGLEARSGAQCRGITFTLPPGTREAALMELWEREMWIDCYRPVWIEAETGEGPVAAFTFAIDPAHPMHTGSLPLADQARYIAAARGKFGACADYLYETWDAMRREGVEDEEMRALVDAVRLQEARG